MAESDVAESILKADRWSKIIALVVAIGFFVAAELLTAETQFNMITAAFAGIGTRIYIPYHASIRTATGKPVQNYEGTGNYHQGAVGASLLVGSVSALAVMVLFEPSSLFAVAAGGGVGLLSFVLLRSLLPS